MNQLKLNSFWVACAGLLAGLVVLFVAFVLPAWSDARTKYNQLKTLDRGLPTQVSDMPGDEDIKKWEDRRKTYIAGYREIAGFYAEHDVELESWFNADLGANPRWESFNSYYQEECQRTEQTLKEAGIVIGISNPNKEEELNFGFNWYPLKDYRWNEIPIRDRPPNTPTGVPYPGQISTLRAIQKRFWIARHVAQACLFSKSPEDKGARLVNRLMDVRFFQNLHPDTAKFPTIEGQQGGMGLPQYDGAWMGNLQGFQEVHLPERLGSTITFGVAVELPIENVALYLRQLLNFGSRPRPLLTILGCRVFVRKQNPHEDTLNFERDPRKPGEDARLIKEIEERQKSVKPAPAEAWITAQVIDFDPSAVPSWVREDSKPAE